MLRFDLAHTRMPCRGEAAWARIQYEELFALWKGARIRISPFSNERNTGTSTDSVLVGFDSFMAMQPRADWYR
jgi:hypothetical protein